MTASPIHVHTAIKSLEPFLGTWRGEGLGFYPTIHVFKYGEEITFATWGKPVVSYSYPIKQYLCILFFFYRQIKDIKHGI